MEGNREFKRSRKVAFASSLAEVRIKLAIGNAFLILLTLGANGEKADYLIAGAYLSLNLFSLFIPRCGYWATHILRIPFIIIDLAVTSYMIGKTGGVDSWLCPFLFLPLIGAIIHFQYAGVFGWSTVVSVILIIATYSKTGFQRFPAPEAIVKIAYLYGFGIFGSFLISRTYRASEEASRELSQWSLKLERLTDYALEVTASSELDDIFVYTIKAVLHNNPALLPALALFEDDQLKIYESSGWKQDWLDHYRENPLRKNSLSLAPLQVFKEPLICTDITRHPELTRIFSETPIRTLSAFPIVVDREVAGVLMIADSTQGVMSDTQIRIITSIAGQCGNALQQVAKLRTVRAQADRDGLTGLFNRRYFDEWVPQKVREALDRGFPLSLILLDVDNFKKYNDSYGHPAGDILLKTVAAVLNQAVRKDDIAARYGGEEFVLVLWNADSELATEIAEHIRTTVAQRTLEDLSTSVTLSAGIATLPEQTKNYLHLVELADKSLYHAKRSGKNCVIHGQF
ncbi:diguanylate cyclase (GGDEF)-like protein [Hydrogenispora ethanolica]|uniref:Diguanylate cyclase (GGDEF)-like protein n=1 Tax=Hydrogenispora ethanolica TaxID=1082276 RepID=A0A4R1QLY6_HYDET|nr:diguanylate cyclase [Hydrogenispora ethanolica]TCL53923.1 diguanylate cyclase (GGDEF)-like protein [Hydrogenispora ethanolica]